MIRLTPNLLHHQNRPKGRFLFIMVEKESVMDKDQIIAAIKEKVELPEGLAEKEAGLLDGKS